MRGKAGAEVEFGNTLLLTEQSESVIVDWHQHRASAPSDAQQLPASLARLESAYGVGAVRALVTDRGFSSAANETLLQTKGIYDGICPKAPARLQERRTEARLGPLQRWNSNHQGAVCSRADKKAE